MADNCSCQCERCGKKEPSNWELYKLAIETRNFEIDLFWKRSNYFLALNTAIAVGLFWMLGQKPTYAITPWHHVMICMFGWIVSILWFRVNLGGRYWQVRWEAAASRWEKKLGVCFYQEERLFSALPEDTKHIVSSNLHNEKNDFFKKEINEWVKTKPSVSNNMIWLSMWFYFGWTGLFIFYAYKALGCHCNTFLCGAIFAGMIIILGLAHAVYICCCKKTLL